MANEPQSQQAPAKETPPINANLVWTVITAIGVLAGGGGGAGLFSTISSQGERITRLESQMEQTQIVLDKMDTKLDRLLEKKP
jgi:hypothetical protein